MSRLPVRPGKSVLFEAAIGFSLVAASFVLEGLYPLITGLAALVFFLRAADEAGLLSFDLFGLLHIDETPERNSVFWIVATVAATVLPALTLSLGLLATGVSASADTWARWIAIGAGAYLFVPLAGIGLTLMAMEYSARAIRRAELKRGTDRK